jgi:thiamine-phosphate pyrophosphorylase
MTNHSRNSQIRGLYAITPDDKDTPGLLRKVRLALIGGVDVLQYRNKAADAVLRLEQALELRELAHEFSVPLIINDDVGLAQQAEADGVHLGREDASVASARALLGEGKIIGVSCYNRAGLALDAARQGADYVAFGSFFASAVKPDAVTATPELLRRARREIELPLVAIGGITVHNGAKLLEAGANALAVISALFSADDIEEAARLFSSFSYPETVTIDRKKQHDLAKPETIR